MAQSVVFSSANNSKLACTKLQAGAQSVHENICRHRARARILRIGICRSEQKRRCATNTADGLSKDRKNLLHQDHRFWHSSAMRTVVRDDVSDHRQPDRGFRARINNLARKIGVRRALTLPNTAAPTAFCFLFPLHQAAQACADFLDRMRFSLAQQIGATARPGSHLSDKFARKFS
jgi:hypothetical protein